MDMVAMNDTYITCPKTFRRTLYTIYKLAFDRDLILNKGPQKYNVQQAKTTPPPIQLTKGNILKKTKKKQKCVGIVTQVRRDIFIN